MNILSNRPYAGEDAAVFLYQNEIADKVLAFRVILKYADGSAKDITYEKFIDKLTIDGITDVNTDDVTDVTSSDFNVDNLQELVFKYKVIPGESSLSMVARGDYITIKNNGDVEYKRFTYEKNENTITITTENGSIPFTLNTDNTPYTLTNNNDIVQVFNVVNTTNNDDNIIVDSIWKYFDTANNINHIISFSGVAMSTSLTIEKKCKVYVLADKFDSVNNIVPVFYIKNDSISEVRYSIYAIYDNYNMLDITNSVTLENFNKSSLEDQQSIVIKVKVRSKEEDSTGLEETRYNVSFKPTVDNNQYISEVIQSNEKEYYDLHINSQRNIGKIDVAAETNIEEDNKFIATSNSISPTHFRICSLDRLHYYTGDNGVYDVPIGSFSRFNINEDSSYYSIPLDGTPLLLEFIHKNGDDDIKYTNARPLRVSINPTIN